jgi:putative membrane protein
LTTLSAGLAGFVAVQHLGFLVLEMFLWKTPFGRKTFGLTREFAEESAPLAMNQGLYNGFLAAGLAWSLLPSTPPAEALHVRVFFLGCVLVAGVFGGLSVKKSILAIQAAPAAAALAATLM